MISKIKFEAEKTFYIWNDYTFWFNDFNDDVFKFFMVAINEKLDLHKQTIK